MKHKYPVIISKEQDGYFVSIPDFNMSTQGNDIPDAINMAKDAIGLIGIDMEDEGKDLPIPHSVKFSCTNNDAVVLVDVDFTEYRNNINIM
jgi:predicted RNase H-like HicB family nuclease